MNKLIVLSGPSGAGKTSILHYLLNEIKELSFSVSACSRSKRKNEVHSKDYYFLSVDEFKIKIKQNAFLEWEEVYENQFYGTLRSEIKRIWDEGKTAIFDIDVDGALSIKNEFQTNCLCIFIQPPSIEVLQKRLIERGSEPQESLKKRLVKARGEIEKSKDFDRIILNDNFSLVCKEINDLVYNFINNT